MGRFSDVVWYDLGVLKHWLEKIPNSNRQKIGNILALMEQLLEPFANDHWSY